MSRFYLRLAIVLIPLFTLLAVTMSALGSTQPIHPALRGFVEGCEGVPQPCWYGIVLGMTTVNESESIMREHGFVLHVDGETSYWQNATWCLVSLSGIESYVSNITISLCESLTLQDVLSVFNASPTYIGQTCFHDYTLVMGNFVIYSDGTSIDTRIAAFRLSAVNMAGNLQMPQNRWRGFGYHYRVTGGRGCG